MEFSIWLWILSFLPIVILLLGISYFNFSTQKTASVSLVVTIILAINFFKVEVEYLFISLGKGGALALYIILIVAGAILLYNTVELAGAFNSIKRFIGRITKDRALQILVLSWAVAPFIQGVSGFGVPVAVIGSLLVGMDFKPVLAITAVLIGHSWAIGFGSMGSSFYALGLVTGLEINRLAVITALLFMIPIILTGLSVIHLYHKEQEVEFPKHILKYIIGVGGLMALVKVLLSYIELPHLGALLAGLAGSLLFMLIFSIVNKGAENEMKLEDNKMMSPLTAITPYLGLVFLVLSFQLPVVKARLPEFVISFDFPGFITGLGYQVEAEMNYGAIDLFSHPVIFLCLSALFASILFLKLDYLQKPFRIITASFNQALSSASSILLLMLMALVMNDAGMLYLFADGLVEITGRFFPFFSPFIGVLGAFLTGSTTSSNVLFGSLQLRAAEIISISPYLLVATQAVGASLGSAVAPAKILIGIATVGSVADGKEGVILNKAAYYTLLISLFLGVVVYLLLQII